MEIESIVECHGDVSLLTLNGEMTIYTAMELKQILADALSGCTELTVSLAGVTEMDTAGVQLLLMLKKASQQQDKSVRLKDHAPPVLKVIEIFDLSGQLGDPVVMPTGRTRSSHQEDYYESF